jgi:hypothetical protein
MRKFLLCLIATIVLGCGNRGPTAPIVGTATYEKFTRHRDRSTTTEFAPIARAKIQAYVGDVQVATGSTREDGTFTLDVPTRYSHLAIYVKVLASSADYDVEVSTHETSFFRSNVYFINTTVRNWAEPAELVATREEASGRLAGAFNIFAQTTRGMSWFEDHVSWEPNFPSLKVHWAVGEDGEGCTCFFPGIVGSHVISVQDLPNNQEDFDDSLLLHEVGHYIHKSFSVNHSPGGEHFLYCGANDLDPRLAWSEGWANAFAQIVIGHGIYIDSGTVNSYFSVDFENLCQDDFGPLSEFTIAAMYIDLVDGSSDMPLDEDNDGLAYSFDQVFDGMLDIGGINPNVLDYFEAMTPEVLSRNLWDEKFTPIGLDEATLRAQLPN